MSSNITSEVSFCTRVQSSSGCSIELFIRLFLELACAVRLLHEHDYRQGYCKVLLNDFCKTIFSIDAKLQTYNLHSLWHLIVVSEKLRPSLGNFGNFRFEFAHHLLSVKFTGSVNHPQLLIERYTRSKNLFRVATDDCPLTIFCNEFMNVKTSFEPKFRMVSSDLMKKYQEKGFDVNARLEIDKIIFESKSYMPSQAFSSAEFESKDKLRIGQYSFSTSHLEFITVSSRSLISVYTILTVKLFLLLNHSF